MIITLVVIAAIALSVFLFTRQAEFGKPPSKERLKAFQELPNFRDGAFRNRQSTKVSTSNKSMLGSLYHFLFKGSSRRTPKHPLPSVKTNLKSLNPSENVLVWLGHSSYFMQLDGKTILVDPIIDDYASPVFFVGKAFDGTRIYSAEDFPDIDYLFITHDHWDHLDYETVTALKSKIRHIYCGLGVGSHLEHWGFDPSIITEKNWDENEDLGDGFSITTTTARHFSGRSFTRNVTLWLSYVLKTPTMKIFIGGDGGYGEHFKQIGEQHGPFDLAVIENGQFNPGWAQIHIFPEQGLKAASELGAKSMLPVHSGKFALALHAWDEPLSRIVSLDRDPELRLLTPMIGEKVRIGDTTQKFTHWWEGID